MKKKILALSMSLALFVCGSTLTASAASSHVHDFSGHQAVASAPDTTSTHMYLYGIDHNGNNIYKTCTITTKHVYCVYVCTICSAQNNDYGSHKHISATYHSSCGK